MKQGKNEKSSVLECAYRRHDDRTHLLILFICCMGLVGRDLNTRGCYNPPFKIDGL